ncbi:hypothetical protein ACLOJK_000583, partial [Asimina triloba]
IRWVSNGGREIGFRFRSGLSLICRRAAADHPLGRNGSSALNVTAAGHRSLLEGGGRMEDDDSKRRCR